MENNIMNITYLRKNNSFKLDTDNTSYVIGIVDKEGFIGHAYYGARIPNEDVTYLMRINENPLVPSLNERNRSSFLDTFPTEFSGNNVGDYRESSIKIRDKNGASGIQLLYREYRIINGKPKIKGLPATFSDEMWRLLGLLDMSLMLQNYQRKIKKLFRNK